MEISLAKDRYYEGIFLHKVVWKWDPSLSDWEKDKHVGNTHIFNRLEVVNDLGVQIHGLFNFFYLVIHNVLVQGKIFTQICQ